MRLLGLNKGTSIQNRYKIVFTVNLCGLNMLLVWQLSVHFHLN